MFNHDDMGSISVIELGTVLHALGSTATENEVLDIIAEMDLDGNGCISFAEFVILMTNKMMTWNVEGEI